jgi:CO/xanthine dehydrogenase Mo-binding subunit
MSQLSTVRLDTNVTPDQGATSSSSSIHRGGPPLRAAAAEARQALLELASVRLGVQPGSLTVTQGNNVSFSVAATGTAPFLYQWQLNGLDLSGDGSVLVMGHTLDAGVVHVYDGLF